MAVSSVSSTSNYYTQAAAAGPVSIATALAAIKANSRTKVTISDSTDNISRNLETLRKLANNITTVSQTDASTVMEVSAGQWAKLGTLLGKFSSNYQLQVSDVSAGNAVSTANNSHVSSFSVTDSSANIAAQMGNWVGKTKLSSVNVTTPTALIGVTAAQLTSQASVIAKLSGNYGLAVSQATAEQAVSYASNLRIKSVSILDTAGAVSSHLDELKSLGLRLKEIRGSDTNVFEVQAEQLQTDALVIGKIYKGFQLSVLGASMDQAQTLVSNKKVVSVDIEDTANNISAHLDVLKRLGSDLHSIHVTDADAESLRMSSVEFGAYAGVLGKILADDAYTVAVSDATVSEAQALSSNSHISSIAVADSSAAIAANLHALQSNAKLSAITQKGKAAALSVTFGQLTDDADALAKIRGNYSLNVSQVAAADALTLATNNSRVTSLSVSDTGEAITDNLQNLAALGKRLTRITQSDNTSALSLTVSQWTSQIGTLSKISGGYSLALSGVSAARAQTLVTDSRVRSVAVSDSAQAISGQLDALHNLGDQLTSITQTDDRALSVSAQQWATQTSTLSKLGDSYSLAVRDARASQITALSADSKVVAVAIADASDNIARQLDAIQDVIDGDAELSLSVRQTGAAKPMAIQASQLERDAAALALISGNYSLSVSDVAAGDASTVGSNGKVVSMGVHGSAEELATSLTSLAELGAKVSTITQDDAGTALALTATQWTTHNTLLNKIDGGVIASISEVKAAGAQALLADTRVSSVSVLDSAAQISSHLDTLQSLGPLLSAVTPSDDAAITLSMDQLTSAASTLEKMGADYTLAVQQATVADAQALLDDAYSHVTSVSVADSSANIAAALDTLQANSKLASIVQTGTATPLQLNKSQLSDDADTLAKILGSYSVAILDAAPADVSTLNANARVASMAVTGSASGIVSQLSALQAAGHKVSAIALETSPDTLSLSYAQWVTHQATLAKITTNYSVAIAGVSAAQAASVARDPRVASLTVSDSTAHINSSLDALQALGPQLSAIAVTDSGTPPAMTLTAAQRTADATALGKIASGNYSLVITAANVNDAQALASDAKVSSIALSDSSANIAASMAALNSIGKLNSITQTGTAQAMDLSASLFTASTSTLAKIQGSYTLNVSQAAANLAATLQANSHVSQFSLQDSASAVNNAFASLATMSKLSSIELSSDDAPIVLTQAQTEAWSDTLSMLHGGYRLHVTAVGMDSLDTVTATPHVALISLTASSQEVSGRFDDLVNLGDSLSRIDLDSLSSPVALTHNQWTQGTSTLAKVQGAYQVALVDVRAENATALAATDHVSSVSVSDSAANISAQFDALAQLGDALDVIDLSDSASLVLSQSQVDANSALLAKIRGEFDIDISA